jgi:hypothetical protein
MTVTDRRLLEVKPRSCICAYELDTLTRRYVRTGPDLDCPWHLVKLPAPPAGGQFARSARDHRYVPVPATRTEASPDG